MIHVAYRLWGGEGFFAKMMGTSMLSMFENTKEKVTVHVLHNERLTPDNRDKFCYIAGQYNQQIKFYNVEELASETLRKFKVAHPMPWDEGKDPDSVSSPATWYWFIVPDIFPDLDKIILLGADTVFNLDVAELWNYDLGDYGFAAIPECYSNVPYTAFLMCIDGLIEHSEYFNVDVMLVKPKFLKENLELFLEGCKFVYEKKYPCAEQDAFNYVFTKKYLKLPGRFNGVVRFLRRTVPPTKIQKAIYHFAGPKPDLNTDDVFNRLYFEYFFKTPWASVDMLKNIDNAIRSLIKRNRDENKFWLLNLTNLLAHRQRAFFASKKDFNNLKKIFNMSDEELLIDATKKDSLNKLLEEMTNSKNKKIFFILIGGYSTVNRILAEYGFKENVDYIDAISVFSGTREFDVDFDSRQIVELL